MNKTLKNEIEYDPEDVWYINTPEGRRDNNGYAAPFPIWWRKYSLQGTGYFIGEQRPQVEWINKKLKRYFPDVKSGLGVDIENSDINFDIQFGSLDHVDFIFCMAVLEHVYDPIMVLRNLVNSLRHGGLLCVSVPSQGFKQHRRPVDCYRFLEDAMGAFAACTMTQLLDYALCVNEWCAIYRK